MNLNEFFEHVFKKPYVDPHSLKECMTRHYGGPFGEQGPCRPGFVYVVRFGDVYKIGSTTAGKGLSSIKSRVASVNKQLGQEGRVVGFIETNCAQGFERWLHMEYRTARVRTEFFRLTDTQLQTIITMDAFNGAPLRFFASFSEYPNMQKVKYP